MLHAALGSAARVVWRSADANAAAASVHMIDGRVSNAAMLSSRSDNVDDGGNSNDDDADRYNDVRLALGIILEVGEKEDEEDIFVGVNGVFLYILLVVCLYV